MRSPKSNWKPIQLELAGEPLIGSYQTMHPSSIHLCTEKYFDFVSHKIGVSNYTKIKSGAFMNNNYYSLKNYLFYTNRLPHFLKNIVH